MAHPNGYVDLRSDTVTQPTPAMRRAMAEAEVGDDQYGEDPTVRRLEERAAEALGKEAACYVASGTMGNLTAILTHCGRGDEVLLGDECHVLWFESGGAAALGGLPFNKLRTDRFGMLDPREVADLIRPVRPGYPRTGVVCLENTHNRCGGTVLHPDQLAQVAGVAHARGVPVHLDGARIFNAAAALGLPASRVVRDMDSVQFCFSKALAAPVGSIVVGGRDFIARLRGNRKIVGGAMRQAGVIAAAALVGLTEMVDRLPEDHRRARRLAEGLAQIPGIAIDLETVQSNIVIFKPERARIAPEEFIGGLAEDGVKISNYGLRGLRMVTHYQITDEDVEKALRTVAALMEGAHVAAPAAG
ncbi:MAG TPA: GntG family PLP-dependent aldolase [Thermomicrobiales bacterium]|nr:GntG family PLP-dependent aldolase [Thermomicrobiales bacterium]